MKSGITGGAEIRVLPERLWSLLVPCTVPSGRICRWNPVLQYSCLLRRIPWRCVRSVVAPRASRSPETSGSPSSEPELSPKGVSTKREPTCGIPSIPRTLPSSPRTAADATAIVITAERVKFREEVLRTRRATCLFTCSQLRNADARRKNS